MKNVIEYLKSNGFYFKKQFGQNFITDEKLLDEIVELSAVTKDDVVMEIGVGAGTLTASLAKRAKMVLGYEIDYKLKPFLDEFFLEKQNVKIVYADFLKQPLEKVENELGEYVVVANLPYYVTSPVIIRFLEQSKNAKKLVVMVQKEVADRLSAKVGGKDYGAITVAIDFCGSAKTLKFVPRTAFSPVPNVDSAVVEITFDRNKFVGVDYQKVRSVVKAGFSGRRKTLANNLIREYGLDRESVENLLESLGIDKNVRGERLSVEDYVKLSGALEK